VGLESGSNNYCHVIWSEIMGGYKHSRHNGRDRSVEVGHEIILTQSLRLFVVFVVLVFLNVLVAVISLFLQVPLEHQEL